MSTIRTATFLHAQQRIRVDAKDRKRRGKTNRRVKCRPPNKKCGGRCIPSDWDCRLRGEGSDPHLLAVGKGSDPLSAIANLQRGGGRILKGLQKLNPAEVEGGRKAIIRGVVKGSPGSIKDKENLKANLVRGTVMLGAVASVGVLGIRGHGLMMGVSVYKKHIGDRLENAADKAVRRLLDNNPITGPGRRAVREGGVAVISNRGALVARTPEAGEALSSLGRLSTERNGRGLFKAPKGESFSDWYNTEIKQLLSKPKLAKDSTESFLQDYYKPSSSGTIKDAAIERIAAERKQLLQFAQQEGVDLSNDLTRDAYAKKLIKPLQVTASMRSKLETDTYDMLTGRFVPETHYSSIKKQIQETYTTFYKEVGDQFPKFYKPDGSRKSVAADRFDFTDKIVIAHARLRARVFQGSEAMVKGSNTADLTHLQFFKLGGRQSDLGKRWTAPRGLILEAAKEVGSSKPKTISEALDILRMNGFKGIDVEDIAPIRPIRTIGAERAAKARGFKLRPEEQQAFDLYSKQVESELLPNGNPKYKTPDEIRRKVQGLIAKDRVGRKPAPKSATVAPRPSATKPPATRSKPVGATAKTSVRAPRLRSAGKDDRGLPISPEGYLQVWDEDNIDEFRKLQARFMRAAKKDMTRPGYTPTRVEVMRKAAEWMEQNGWLTDEPLRRPLSNYDSADRSDAYLQSFWTVRHDKKCGKSGIAPGKKCSKATSAIGAVAAVAGAAALGAAVVKNKNVIKQAYSYNVPRISDRLIQAMSTDRVEQGLSRIPEKFQQQARQLVGKAKQAAAYMAVNAEGYKLLSVNNANNFSTYASKTGHITSLGTVGDSLLQFNSKRSAFGKAPNGAPIPIYGMQFSVDNGLAQKESVGLKSAQELAGKTRAMYKEHFEAMQPDTLMYAVPENADGLGYKRRAIYKRFGFRELSPLQKEKPWSAFDTPPMFAVKTGGKAHKIADNEVDWFSKMFSLSGRIDEARLDKRCGKSGIDPKKKCSKTTRNLAIGGAAVGTALLLASNKKVRGAAANSIKKVRAALDPKLLKERPQDWTDIPPAHRLIAGENYRERKYSVITQMKPVQADVISARVAEVAKHEGVIPENVQHLADFVKAENMEIDYNIFNDLAEGKKYNMGPMDQFHATQMKSTMENGYAFSGMYWFKDGPAQGTKIYVTPKRLSADVWADKSADAVASVNRIMDKVKTRKYIKEPKNLAELRTRQETFSTYGDAKDDAADLIVSVHELGHAVHDRADWYLPTEIKVGPKIYKTQGPEFSSLLRKNSSYYAMLDNDAGLVADAGARREAFAENYVYYIFAGERMKTENPAVYAWVDAIVQKQKKPPTRA